jgi:hypothetical protein
MGGLVSLCQITLDMAILATDSEGLAVVVHQARYLARGDSFEGLNILEELFGRLVLGRRARPRELARRHETE